MTNALLFRSCSPSIAWWDPARDKPSSQLFLPNTRDNGELSVASSLKTTAETFHDEFTEKFGLDSRGIWAVSADELNPVEGVQGPDGGRITLEYFEDEGDKKPKGHCLIDMKEYKGKKLKKIAQALRNKACERGIQYP